MDVIRMNLELTFDDDPTLYEELAGLPKGRKRMTRLRLYASLGVRAYLAERAGAAVAGRAIVPRTAAPKAVSSLDADSVTASAASELFGQGGSS